MCVFGVPLARTSGDRKPLISSRRRGNSRDGAATGGKIQYTFDRARAFTAPLAVRTQIIARNRYRRLPNDVCMWDGTKQVHISRNNKTSLGAFPYKKQYALLAR